MLFFCPADNKTTNNFQYPTLSAHDTPGQTIVIMQGLLGCTHMANRECAQDVSENER